MTSRTDTGGIGQPAARPDPKKEPRETLRRPTRGPARRGSRWRRRFLPPEHGAWAMLIVPYLAGLIIVGTTWVHLPLAAAWLAGYPLSYYVFQSLKSRRPHRYRSQLTGYAAVTLPLAAVVVAARPEVLWYAPAYAVLLSVNAWYAWQRRERALGNDFAAVVQSCLMVLVVATVAGVPLTVVAGAFVACTAYFAGTAFYVKTMIRERGNPAYRRWSIRYHSVALLVSGALSPVLVAFFSWLLLRAWLLPHRRLVPLQVGLIEIGNSALLLVAIAYVWG